MTPDSSPPPHQDGGDVSYVGENYKVNPSDKLVLHGQIEIDKQYGQQQPPGDSNNPPVTNLQVTARWKQDDRLVPEVWFVRSYPLPYPCTPTHSPTSYSTPFF